MYKIWADGSVRGGNPGLAGIAFIVKCGLGGYVGTSLLDGDRTNNEAEYIAVIKALEYLIEVNNDNEECVIYTDSALVHGQLVLGWKINFDHLKKLNTQVRNLINSAHFNIKFEVINRDKNCEANSIAQALTTRAKGEKSWNLTM